MMRMMINTLPGVDHHAHALLAPHPRGSLSPGASFAVAVDGLLQCSSSSTLSPGRPSMRWNAAETKRGRLLTCFAIEESSQKPDFVAEKSLWPCLLPRPFIYSSSFSDVDPVQLSELWATTLKVRRDPKKILKALRHSFAGLKRMKTKQPFTEMIACLFQSVEFIVVLAEVDEASSSGVVRRLKTLTDLPLNKDGSLPLRCSGTEYQLRDRRGTAEVEKSSNQFGVGRAISDGTFIASICDVAVDPAYQRRGIGRRIVKKLVENMKKTGGPSGYAVFPPPIARRFFWMIGFRSDKKYRLMAYRGEGEGDERDVRLFDREKLLDKELLVRRAE